MVLMLNRMRQQFLERVLIILVVYFFVEFYYYCPIILNDCQIACLRRFVYELINNEIVYVIFLFYYQF